MAFEADTPELPGSGGFRPQAYLRARPSGVTTLISAPDRLDEAGDARIGARSLSSDGRFVLFQSEAPAFGAVLQNGRYGPQVLLRDVVAGTTTLISAASDGAAGDGESYVGAIDGAGDKVVFGSTAPNITGPDPGNSVRSFVRDVATGATRMLDVSATVEPGDGNSFGLAISSDGAKAAFASSATNLPDTPPDNHSHAYLVDLATGAMQIVDRANDGAVGDGDASDLDLNANGSRVAFRSNAENFGIANNGRSHVWVRDLPSSTLTWASVPEDGNAEHGQAVAPSLSADGHKVAFTNRDPNFGYGQTTDRRRPSCATSMPARRPICRPASRGASSTRRS